MTVLVLCKFRLLSSMDIFFLSLGGIGRLFFATLVVALSRGPLLNYFFIVGLLESVAYNCPIRPRS